MKTLNNENEFYLILKYKSGEKSIKKRGGKKKAFSARRVFKIRMKMKVFGRNPISWILTCQVK